MVLLLQRKQYFACEFQKALIGGAESTDDWIWKSKTNYINSDTIKSVIQKD